jgi:hypothetical protein
MNETGQYPGQTWLWLLSFWYQVPPFTSDTGFLGLNGGNADLGIIIIMTGAHNPARDGAVHPGAA